MTVTFRITAEDFTTYYLYVASRSKVVTAKRNLRRYGFSLLFLALSAWFYLDENLPIAIGLSVLAVLWFIFYPRFSKASQKRFYERYIAENYKNRINRQTEFTTSPGFISIIDGKTHSKIHVSEFEKLIGIEPLFFLTLKSGTAYIIPKNQVDLNAFKAEIGAIGIPVFEENHWQWQ